MPLFSTWKTWHYWKWDILWHKKHERPGWASVTETNASCITKDALHKVQVKHAATCFSSHNLNVCWSRFLLIFTDLYLKAVQFVAKKNEINVQSRLLWKDSILKKMLDWVSFPGRQQPSICQPENVHVLTHCTFKWFCSVITISHHASSLLARFRKLYKTKII